MIRLKLCVMTFFALFLAASLAEAAGITLISKDQLRQELSNPEVTVLDVRVDSEWNSSQWKIQGAKRESPADVGRWMNRYPKDKTIVLYCD